MFHEGCIGYRVLCSLAKVPIASGEPPRDKENSARSRVSQSITGSSTNETSGSHVTNGGTLRLLKPWPHRGGANWRPGSRESLKTSKPSELSATLKHGRQANSHKHKCSQAILHYFCVLRNLSLSGMRNFLVSFASGCTIQFSLHVQ